MNLKNIRTLLAVHAHPDDESIGTGGILAKYAARESRRLLPFVPKGRKVISRIHPSSLLPREWK